MTRKTYWHKHPRGFANECDMLTATTKIQRDDLDSQGYERLSRKAALAEIKFVNAENDAWGSNRAFGVMRIATILEHDTYDPSRNYGD